MQDILEYIDTQRDWYIGMIQRACQQPSISTQALGIPAVSGPGGGNPDSRIHAPNENMFVEDYVNAITGMALLFAEFATTAHIATDAGKGASV